MKVAYYILILFLFSCNGNVDKTTLEGKWVLSADITFNQLGDVELPLSVTTGIESSSNSMSYIFRSNKTTYPPKDTKENEINWLKFKVISESINEIKIEVNGKNNIYFVKYKDCIGLPVTKYSYNEYYCFAL